MRYSLYSEYIVYRSLSLYYSGNHAANTPVPTLANVTIRDNSKALFIPIPYRLNSINPNDIETVVKNLFIYVDNRSKSSDKRSGRDSGDRSAVPSNPINHTLRHTCDPRQLPYRHTIKFFDFC
jgi:hypothetical protein